LTLDSSPMLCPLLYTVQGALVAFIRFLGQAWFDVKSSRVSQEIF
jgi:hypothetical protein